jgi:hypothetical protein
MSKITSFNDFGKHYSHNEKLELRADSTMLSDLQKDTMDRAYNKEWGQSKYKMWRFVSEAQFTPFGKMKQCMMEAKAREATVELLELEVEKFRIEMEMSKRDAEQQTDELAKQLYLVKAEQSEINWKRSKKRCAECYEERDFFLSLATDILEGPNGKTPDGRYLSEIIGTPEEDQYEYQYWTVRMANQAALDIMQFGRIGSGNLEAILMMDQKQQADVIGLANELSFRIENRSLEIRNQVAEALKIENAPRQGNITEMAVNMFNETIGSDIKEMTDELTRKMISKTKPDEGKNEDLNDVYSL